MAQLGMFTRAERLGLKVGDKIEPLMLPLVEDAFRTSQGELASKTWFILFIDPAQRSAERVERFVARFGFTCFWPRAKSIRRVKVRKNGLEANARHQPVEKRIVISPALPRYMLVEMPSENAPFMLLDGHEARANGVVGFVMVGAEKATMRKPIVTLLMEREAAGDFDETVKKVRKQPEWLASGKPVRVKDGPFASFNAVIEQLIGDNRLRATISIFGRQTRCNLELDQVEALHA